MIRRILLLLLTTTFTSVQRIQAQHNQPFGNNRVRIDNFDWHVLSGRNVDIYYYPEEELIARFAFVYTERIADSLRARFNLGAIEEKAQVIVYAGHMQFNQTNTIPVEIPEGVVGFTELSEMRVALPYLGNFAQFRNTITHELVHYYHLEKIRSYLRNLNPRAEGNRRCVATGRAPRGNPQWLIYIPGWWVEGLAEYWGSEQDTDDETYVRDLVLHGNVPSIEDFSRMSNFAIYALGRELVRFIGQTYGENKIIEIYENANCYSTFHRALAGTLGVTLEDLGNRFEYYLQARYSNLYGENSAVRRLDVSALRLGNAREFNVLPKTYKVAVSVIQNNLRARDVDSLSSVERCGRDSLTAFVFISPVNRYPTIYESIIGCDSNNRLKVVRSRQILRGFDRIDFESFHFMSRMDVRSDSNERVLTFIAQNTGRDFLYVLDLNTLELITGVRFDGLISLNSPSFCGENSIVFVGMERSGTADLYRFDRISSSLERITNDIYLESDPACDVGGGRIAFSSDRTPSGRSGATNLFILNAGENNARQITYGAWNDASPEWSSNDSSLVFVSDRDGIRNIYEISEEGIIRKLTNYASGTYQPNYVNNDSALVFMGFHEGNYNIYYTAIDAPRDSTGTFEMAAINETGWGFFENREDSVIAFEMPERAYTPRLHVARIPSIEGVLTPWGVSGMVNLLANDALNNHLLSFGAAGSVYFKQGLQDYDFMAGSIYYANQSRRMTWGLGISASHGLKLNRYLRNVLYADEAGITGIIVYPMSRFRRIEAASSFRFSDQRLSRLFADNRADPYSLLQSDSLNYNRRGFIAENELSIVYDNTLWVITGPIDGSRYRINLGLTTNLRDLAMENAKISIDYRRYLRIRGETSYAFSLFGYASTGRLPERIMVGGSTSLRLYSRDIIFGSFYADRGWMINQEIRTPMIDVLYARTPLFGILFPHIQGALFFDVGQFYLQGNRSGGVWGSYGLGIRIPFMMPEMGSSALRIDIGRRFYSGAFPNHQEFRNFNRSRIHFWFGSNF